MAGALSGEAAIAAAAPRGARARRPARSASPGAFTRGRVRAKAAASRLPARGSSFGDANAPDGARGAPDGATPAPTNLTSHVRRAPPRASRVVPRAADGDNSYGSGSDYETGQTEVMRSVAERVKAARELAKRLASREEELAARNGTLPPTQTAPAPPAPPPPPNPPGPPPGTEAESEAAESEATTESSEADALLAAQGSNDESQSSSEDEESSYDETEATEAAARDLMGEYNGNADAAAAAAAARSKLAEMEAAAAEAEASAFAARAVSDMDDAVTRIRQEAAKRVATAERERDRAKEQSRVAVAEVKQKKAAIEEMLRQIKLDADTRVRDAEDMMEEWERLAETSRLAKLAAEEAMETKIKAAEEAAAADVAAAEKRAAAKTAEAETALAGAKRDVDAAKIVQEEISRQEKEKYERLTAEATAEADERVAEAERALEEATRRANEAQDGARSEAEEILKEELKSAEEALNAAEEIARIEVAAAEEAAAVLVAEKEEEARKAVEAAEAKVKKAVKQKEEEMQRRVVAAQEKAAVEIAEAREEAEEAAKTAEAIAAAKDAVAKAVEEAEAEVASSMKKASESEKEAKTIRAAADARIDELTADFQKQIEETREEAKQKAEADIETAVAKAEAAEQRVDEIKKESQKRADEAVEAAERATNEAIAAAKKRREEDVATAKSEAAAAIEAAKADFEEKLEAARAKTKKAREEAAQFRQAASEAAEWEVAAAKAEAEANAAREREAKADAAALEAEKARDEALEKLTDAELAAIAAGKETDAERAKVQEQIAATAAAVQAAVSEANEFSVMEIQKVRDELKAAEESASRRVAEAERGAKQARVDLERLAADKLSAEEHLEVKLASALAEKEDADTRADEARRVAEDLQANEPMERAIEFEKRVASAVAELERAVAAEREKAEAAETSVQQLTFKLGSLQHELETAQAELELSSSAELREAKGEGRVQAEIAALRVALEARDAEIRKLRGDAEGGDGAGREAAPMPDHGPGASAAHIAAAQAAAGVAPAQPPAQPAGTPGSGDKTAEELELEDLLNEVMALKGEAGETTTETPTPTPTETTTETPTAAPVAPVEPERTMESVYAEAYHATLAARKAARRKEAEAWAGKEVAVVASSVKEVYHWLGGGPRHGDSAIIYNRRNPNGLGDGGQLFMHLGYNGWQGDPRQVGMRPLSHDHPSRAEYWLNDQGGDWWIAEPVFVPPEANTLDFVFSDGEGEYDNSGGKDYHSPVSGEDGSPPAEVDHVGEREAALERESGHLDVALAERAGRAAERKFVSRRGFDKKIKEDPATAKVVVVPDRPVAGGEIEIFYRHAANDTSDPKAPLRGAADIFIQGGWNRWTHPDGFGPMRMEPAPRPPGGERAQSALVAKLHVPQDAHVCDFVFTDDARTMEGRYDSRDGLDYHASVAGATGGTKPSLRVVHVAVEMAPIAKVGGMGDVVTALARAVIEDGHSVEVILPKYDCMDAEQIENLDRVDAFAMKDDVTVYAWKGEVEEVPVTFLQPDTGHFDVGCIYGRGDDHVRFEYFSECALAYLAHVGDVPDVIHAHDWSTSHVCFARRDRLPENAATVLTIHNLQFGDDLIGRAMRKCTFATTVSPTYAEEISNHNAIAANASKMVGIRNGIDVELWDPLTDEYMPLGYDADTFAEGKSAARRELSERLGMELCETRPLVGVVARLTQQKGIHLIKHACWRALERGGQFVLLGSSPDGNVQNDFNAMAYDVGGQYPGQSGFVFAYDEPLSHLVYAASDMLLVPSMFEPCGLTQMIAMRYGTVPVVRRTGGLKDTVFDVDEDAARARDAGLRVNGFAFEGSQDYDIDHALDRALMTYDAEPEKWRSLVGDIMRQDWGWNDPAKTYVEHYWKAAKSMKDAYFSNRNKDDDER